MDSVWPYTYPAIGALPVHYSSPSPFKATVSQTTDQDPTPHDKASQFQTPTTLRFAIIKSGKLCPPRPLKAGGAIITLVYYASHGLLCILSDFSCVSHDTAIRLSWFTHDVFMNPPYSSHGTSIIITVWCFSHDVSATVSCVRLKA